MDEILRIIERYGADTCILAILINLSTGLAKIPLKRLSAKKGLGNRLNKYITLIPPVFGILYAGLYQWLAAGRFWTDNTATLAAASASLSLAVYAILEKFFAKEAPAIRPIADEQSAQAPEKIILGRKPNETEAETAQISGQTPRV